MTIIDLLSPCNLKVRILTSQYRSLQGHRILVRIDSWPVNSQYPQGHFVSVVGKMGDLETEIDTILAENDIQVSQFSQGILNELPSLESSETWRPEPEEVARRKDLRDILVMSIDPIGCEDVDDALSVRKLENGNLEVNFSSSMFRCGLDVWCGRLVFTLLTSLTLCPPTV